MFNGHIFLTLSYFFTYYMLILYFANRQANLICRIIFKYQTHDMRSYTFTSSNTFFFWLNTPSHTWLVITRISFRSIILHPTSAGRTIEVISSNQCIAIEGIMVFSGCSCLLELRITIHVTGRPFNKLINLWKILTKLCYWQRDLCQRRLLV